MRCTQLGIGCLRHEGSVETIGYKFAPHEASPYSGEAQWWWVGRDGIVIWSVNGGSIRLRGLSTIRLHTPSRFWICSEFGLTDSAETKIIPVFTFRTFDVGQFATLQLWVRADVVCELAR